MRKFLALLGLAAATNIGSADFRYTVTPDVVSKSIGVKMVMDHAESKVTLQMPVWAPGFYKVLNFADKLSDFRVTDPSGNDLKFFQEGPSKWIVVNPNKTDVQVTYRVMGDDPGLGFFRVHMGNTNCFINGAGAFLYSPTRMNEPMHINFVLPTGWNVATPMEPAADGFVSQGYDEFIDHPIQLGIFERRDFEVNGIPFSAVYVSNDGVRCDMDEETARLKVLSMPAIKLMGKASFKRYMYIIHLAVGDFNGGLEHRAANVIAVTNSRPIHLDELATHEYFHAWNVKQIRPSILGPFDYTQPIYTANLWFAEGVTDYYAYITAHRSGIFENSWLLSRLGQQIEDLQGMNSRKEMTLEQCSKRAWETGFGVAGDLSYYTKGLVCGLIFDAAIRDATKGQKSLDDVMRLLYARHELPKPGYDEDEIRMTINEVAGTSLDALYVRMIRSKSEMPYDELAKLGLRALRPGGTYLGYGFGTSAGAVRTMSNGVRAAGLREGDTVMQINGLPSDQPGLLKVGAKTYIAKIIRNGKNLSLTLPVSKINSANWAITRDPFATNAARERYNEWFKR